MALSACQNKQHIEMRVILLLSPARCFHATRQSRHLVPRVYCGIICFSMLPKSETHELPTTWDWNVYYMKNLIFIKLSRLTS